MTRRDWVAGSLVAAAGAALALAAATWLVPPRGGDAPAPPPTSSAPSPWTHASAWPVPRDDLTPGAVAAGCTLPRPRADRDVSAAEKRLVDRRYGYTGPHGLAHLEYDHRVPFALCGDNGPANVWPEPYDGAPVSRYVHNRKDQLEARVSSLVRARRLTVTDAQRVFLGDWRRAWCLYVHSPGVTCDL